LDYHEGTIVCTDCGHVLSENMYIEKSFELKNTTTCTDIEDIKELLERLNFPTIFAQEIYENVKKGLESKKSKKYLIPFSIYKTLNEIGYPISIKDISSVSGIPENYIYDMQNNEDSIILNHISLLEKYCTILGFDYKTYSVIKELIPDLKTGHNPLTIIASTIYKYCKENKLKYSMKYIASIVGISSVSIQRFLKKC
jgi:transcription initiation factor TFIIIB Brf1 subunit/transcription initiation factor TFIIB